MVFLIGNQRSEESPANESFLRIFKTIVRFSFQVISQMATFDSVHNTLCQLPFDLSIARQLLFPPMVTEYSAFQFVYVSGTKLSW